MSVPLLSGVPPAIAEKLAEFNKQKRFRIEKKGFHLACCFQRLAEQQGNPLELILADSSVYAELGGFALPDREVDIKTGAITVVSYFQNPTDLLRPATQTKGPLGRFFAGFNRWFERGTNGYISVTRILVRKTVRTLLCLAVIAAAAAQLSLSLPTGFLPEEDNGYLIVILQLPDAASLQRTDAVARKIEAMLDQTPGVRGYNALTGFNAVSGALSSYSATFFVRFKPWEERRTQETSAKGILAAINRQLGQLPEATTLADLP